MALNQQRKSFSIGGPVLLIVLLALSLACVVLYAREGSGSGPVHSVQNAVSGIAAPFKFVGSFGGSLIEGAGTALADATASEAARESLREQNQQLSERASQLEAYIQKDRALQDALGLHDVYGYGTVDARVIGKSTDAYSRIVTIDKGANDGLANGLAVMGQSGLVGLVVQTTGSTSEVRLVGDAQSGVSAMVQSSRVEGVVNGSLAGTLSFEDMAADSTVEEGDVIITSGLDGRSRKGLIIGTVTQVEKNANGATVRATVAPNGDIGPMQDVRVVLDAQTGDPSLGSGEDSSLSSDEASSSANGETDGSGGEAASPSTLSGLRKQNQQLRERVSRLEEYMQESERLQVLIDTKDAYQFGSLAARVVGRSTEWSQIITIDKGTDDGLQSGLSVMGQSGLVGMIVSATPTTADVRLIKDAQSGVSAMVQSSGVEGIVRGSIEGTLYLEDMAADATVEEGDVVITSGLGGSYPKGLVIGTVTKVEKNASGSTVRAVVAPGGDSGLLQEVLVVVDMQSDGAASSTFRDPNASNGNTPSGSNAAASNNSNAANSDGAGAGSGDAGTSGDEGGSADGANPSATDPEGDANDES